VVRAGGGVVMARKALGKGLEALIGDTEGLEPAAAREVIDLPIDQIGRSPLQPRTSFNPERLDELARSIRERGVIQPVTVRARGNRAGAGGYELVAGERRVLAAKQAGYDTVPAMVIEANDEEALQLALIENIQRDDLNPIEHARAYHEMASRFKLTQDQVAQRVGKDRASVANYLRLLTLSERIRKLIEEEKLSFGHARALLGATTRTEQERIAKLVVERGLSVREVEALVAGARPRPKPGTRQKPPKDIHVAELEAKLSRALGTRVSIADRGKGGRISIDYYSLDDLDRLLARLGIE
jgi:ParB family chromosome partitioning protein